MTKKINYKNKTAVPLSRIDWALTDPDKILSNKDFTILKAKELITQFKLNVPNDEVENFAWHFLSDAIGGFWTASFQLFENSPGQNDYKDIFTAIAIKAEKLSKEFDKLSIQAKDFTEELSLLNQYTHSYKIIEPQRRDSVKKAYHDALYYKHAFKSLATHARDGKKKIKEIVPKKTNRGIQSLTLILEIITPYYFKYSGKKPEENFFSRDNEYSGDFFEFCKAVVEIFVDFYLEDFDESLHRSVKASINSTGFGKRIQKIITKINQGKFKYR
jgi:hypothetical protein